MPTFIQGGTKRNKTETKILEMYERVIGSLVSLLIAALALILRSSG